MKLLEKEFEFKICPYKSSRNNYKVWPGKRWTEYQDNDSQVLESIKKVMKDLARN